MKKTRIIFLLLTIAFLLPSSLGAFDFGLLLDQYAAFGSYTDDSKFFDYRAGLVPRLSHYFNDKSGFFVAGSMTFGYKNKEFYVPVIELLRTEFSYNSGSLGLKIGRFHYSDPLSIIADSLYDGVQVSYGTSVGRFSLGAWYTGFLYKKNAHIVMLDGQSGEEQIKYDAPLKYSDFSKTYFAPKRMLAALDWEHLSLFDFLQVQAAALGQIDVSGSDNKLHSQYFILSAGVPVKSFLFEAGGSFEAIQLKGAKPRNYFALTGKLGINWTLPTKFHSRLSLTGHYASGENNYFGAFKPVTTKSFGEMLQAKMTNIMFLDLSYSMRINKSVGANITAAYFRRNDSITYNTFYIGSGNDGKKNLGGEIFARVIWSPFSDLNLNFGGGAFIPAMGDVWKDEKPRWRFDLSAILALY